MRQKYMAIAVIMLFSVSVLPAQDQVTIEQEMFTIDSFEHPLEDFAGILKSLSEEFEEYSKEEVGNKIIELYDNLHKNYPEISIYDILESMQGLAENMKGLKLSDLISVYKFLKSQGEIDVKPQNLTPGE